MTFGVTPAAGSTLPSPPGAVDVACIDFVGDPATLKVTRGVGENSHVITVLVTTLVAAMNFNRATNSMYVPLIEDI